MIKRLNHFSRVLAMLAGLLLVAALLACNDNPTPVESSPPEPRAPLPDLTDAKRLSDGATKLIDAMSKPTASFHFSFKGQENLNDDKTQVPHVGPVAMQVEVRPGEISLTESRGSTLKTAKAKESDEVNWAMANLTTLGVMTNPNFVIALGSTVTSPPTTDLVGATLADKYSFDTSAATSTQKRSLDAARAVLSSIKECKGTAWIAEDSGLLIKFNLDADYVDKYNHAWKEHYEGNLTPK